MKKKLRHSEVARLLHWIYVPAMVLSAISGFYINRPKPVYFFKTMRTAKKIHSFAQFILIFAYLARVLYAIQNKNYKEIIPNAQTMAGLPAFLKYEFFLSSKKPKYPKYNPVQKIMFLGFALLIPMQIISGLALRYSNSWQKLAKIAGGLNPLRSVHYFTSLMLSILATGHLYFALSQGWDKVRSIFTGYE